MAKRFYLQYVLKQLSTKLAENIACHYATFPPGLSIGPRTRGVHVIGIPVDIMRPVGFPWEQERISSLHGNGENGNNRVGMGWNGNAAFFPKFPSNWLHQII